MQVSASIQNKIKGAALAIGIAMLAFNLVACDRGEDSEMNTNSDAMSSGYDAGYEFGVKLALLRQQQPDIKLDDAFKGLLDAVSETSTLMSSAEMCASLQAAGKPATEAAHAAIPARTRGFKDDFAALNARREGVVVLPSGVQYEVLKHSNGKQPVEGDAVLVNYEASLTNGTVFDTTYEDGEPFRLEMDEIAAPGLKEALLLMGEGAQWRVVIPPSMGFGRTGNNQLRRRDLIYEIELISIEKPAPAKT